MSEITAEMLTNVRKRIEGLTKQIHTEEGTLQTLKLRESELIAELAGEGATPDNVEEIISELKNVTVSGYTLVDKILTAIESKDANVLETQAEAIEQLHSFINDNCSDGRE